MKKFLLLSLLALAGATALRAVEKTAREEFVTRVESCEAILQDFMADTRTAIPSQVLARAKALIIVNQFKAGFLFGVKDGYGVILVKKPNGRWSLPVLLNSGELSLGLQVGAQTVETVMVITDDKTPRILFTQRFNVGADAKAVIGPAAAEAQRVSRELLDTPVLVYTKSRGVFAGATVKTGWLQRNDKANYTLYNTAYTLPELLYGDWVQPVPEVKWLMDFVQKLAP